MKQMFDWLREQMEKVKCEVYSPADVVWNNAVKMCLREVNEAEAKWKSEVCEWKLEDAEANLYVTSCEQRQLIFEGTPRENDYRFCPYCGRKIVEVADEQNI